MPTYLCHGFKWDRAAIRIFVVMKDIDDATADFIIPPASNEGILAAIAQAHSYMPFGGMTEAPTETPRSAEGEPTTASEGRTKSSGEETDSPLVSPITLLEEFNLADESDSTRPYAYVADHVVKVHHGVNIAEEMDKYDKLPKVGEDGWFERLQKELPILGPGTGEMGWHVVVCDDEVRAVDESDDEGTPEAATQRHADPGAGKPTTPSKEKPREQEPEENLRRKGSSSVRSLRSLLPLGKKRKD